MTPNVTDRKTVFNEEEHFEKLIAPQAAPRKYEYVYYNIFFLIYLHIAAVYGLFNSLFLASWYTIFFNIITMITTELGVTAGAHRLWTHKSYKAKLPLQFVLMLFQSMSLQGTAIEWARDHRMHHKYSDTDADPHNATRGLFFSHYGWILVRKHPELIKRGKYIDMSDLTSNPVLRFQQKYVFTSCYILLTGNKSVFMKRVSETLPRTESCSVGRLLTMWTDDLVKIAGIRWMRVPQDLSLWRFLGETYVQKWTYSLLMQNMCTLLLPTIIPLFLWGESLSVAWHMNTIRIIINTNMGCSVNSVAHAWGYRPYDSNIYPVENIFISAITLGEGFHNYHHVFPWDYRTAELTNNYMNLTTKFIDFCAWMGWAYNLKTVSEDVILARSKRTGDGSLAKIEEEMIQRTK